MRGKVLNVGSFLEVIKPTRLDGLALLTGGIMGLAWPESSISGLAWLAPAALLALIWISIWNFEDSETDRSWGLHLRQSSAAARVGFFYGIGLFIVILSWLRMIPFPVGAMLGWFSLSCYLALYMAVWGFWMAYTKPRPEKNLHARIRGIIPTENETRKAVNIPLWSGIAHLSWYSKFRWVLSGSIAWVLLEWCYGHFLTGFPWTYIATTQYQLTPLIQIASTTGILGVSFIIVWVSLGIFLSVATILGEPGQLGWRWIPDLAPAGLTALLAFLWGQGRIQDQVEGWDFDSDSALRVAAIQPSIPQSLIWDPKETSTRFDQLMDFTREAADAESEVDLIIWPESALLGMELEMYEQISDFAISRSIWMVLGVEDAEVRSGSITDAEVEWDVYNAAALVDPRGHFRTIYRKRHLVIFGEYVPLSQWIPPLRYLTPIEGGFQRGSEAVPFELEVSHPEKSKWKLQPLICFEDVLPDLTRRSLEADTDFILNLTNDGWFGEESAHWQHWSNATFRAVENGVPLLQCGNNGVTLWVDPVGRTHGRSFSGKSADESQSQYAPGWKSWIIPDISGKKAQLTYYRQQGDRFLLWGAALVAFMVVTDKLRIWKFVEQKPASTDL